jgi:Gpi18-like mannosyltransferase
MLFFLVPTVYLNGAHWGQCDIVYGSMVLASIYYLVKEKYALAYVFLGLAFAFKLRLCLSSHFSVQHPVEKRHMEILCSCYRLFSWSLCCLPH